MSEPETNSPIKMWDLVEVCAPAPKGGVRNYWRRRTWRKAEVMVVFGSEALIRECGIKGGSWIPIAYLRKKEKKT